MNSQSCEIEKLHHKYDPDTSVGAAATIIATGRQGTQRREVLEAYRTFSPCTARELSEWSGLDYHTISRRQCELRRNGLLNDSGVRRDGGVMWQINPNII